MSEPKTTLTQWLFPVRWPEDWSKARPLGHFLGFCLVLIGLAAGGGLIIGFLQAIWLGDPTGEAIRNIGLALAALIGAPFLIWRTSVAARQARIAGDALFNDKVNAAAQALSARHQIGKDQWEDDLVTRAAAIDRLEGLAQEAFARDDIATAKRIARLLSIYVQELSKEPDDLKAGDMPEQARTLSFPAKTPPEEDASKIRGLWKANLRIGRSGMQRAVQSLGRINPRESNLRNLFDPRSSIDLSYCNLQAMYLSGLNFRGASFLFAAMEGSVCRTARFDGANFRYARLRGTEFADATANGADFSRSLDFGITGTRMQLRGANLCVTRFDDSSTFMGMTPFSGLDLHGAALDLASVMQSDRREDYLETIFVGDTNLPKDSPEHWVRMNQANEDYFNHWRAWAATLSPPVTIAPDYRP